MGIVRYRLNTTIYIKICFATAKWGQSDTEKLNTDFSNKIFVSCLTVSKMYSPSVILKGGLMIYVFESLKSKEKK